MQRLRKILRAAHPKVARRTRRPQLAVECLEERQLLTVVGSITMSYNGGAVLNHVEAQSMYFGPVGQTPNTAPLDGFLKAVVGSAYMDMLNEYNAYRGTFGGDDVTSTDWTFRTVNGQQIVDDSTIQLAIKDEIAANRLSPNTDAEHLYVVYVAPGFVVNNPKITGPFFGYHDSFVSSGLVIPYAVIPDPGTSLIPNLNSFQTQVEATSHELAEGVTDPVPGTGWFDTKDVHTIFLGDEIADVNNLDYAYRNIKPDYFSNGTNYAVQRIWSTVKQTAVLLIPNLLFYANSAPNDYSGDGTSS